MVDGNVWVQCMMGDVVHGWCAVRVGGSQIHDRNTISACNTKFKTLFRRVQARTVRITLQLFPEYCQDFCIRKRLGRSFHQQGTVNEYVVSKNKMKVILCLSEMIPWIVLSETYKPRWWLKLRCLRLRTEKCPNPLNVVKPFFMIHSISDKPHKNKYRSGCLLYIKLDRDLGKFMAIVKSYCMLAMLWNIRQSESLLT